MVKRATGSIFIAVAACRLQRLVFKGNISIGYLVTATNLINFTNQPVQVISQSVSKIIATTDIRHRLVLVRQNTHQGVSNFTGSQVGNMSLQHVYFRYNNNSTILTVPSYKARNTQSWDQAALERALLPR